MVSLAHIPPDPAGFGVRSVEVILTHCDGSRSTYTSDEVYGFDHWGPFDHNKLAIKAGRWKYKKEIKPPVAKKRVNQLQPGDITYTFGEVEHRGTVKRIAGESYYPVKFKDGSSHILRAGQEFTVKSSGVLRDTHIRKRELHIEKSISDPDTEVYLRVVNPDDWRDNRGIWVNKQDLRDAIDNPEDPR